MSNNPNRVVAPMQTQDWLRHRPIAARFILQGPDAARRAAGSVFGLALPEQVCQSVANNERAALWLGPDERLLLDWKESAQALQASLESAMQAVPHSLVDISHRQVALQLSGAHAADILSTGCPLDLDLAAFPSGMCTRTVFAKAEVILWRRGNDDFHLEIGRSFADYVSRWMREAAQDFATD